MARKVTVREVPKPRLGRMRVWGIAEHSKYRITLDTTTDPKQFFGAAIHELLHLAMPTMEEAEVLRVESVLRETLWRMRFRRVSQ